MPDFERTATIDAPPDLLFDYLADITHLPEYIPAMASVHPTGGEAVEVETQIAGQHHHDHGWFHVDESEHRIEWGSKDNTDYRGWISVDALGRTGSQLTIHLSRDEPADTDQQLTATINSIKRRMESG